jgi:HEAT repeat protein
VPIKASSARHIETLVADLSSASTTTREAAIARLTVIGARAVARLVAVVESSAAVVPKIAALRALEVIADARSLEPALRAIDDTDRTVAVAAIGVARSFVLGPHGAKAIDRLTGTALDRTRSEPIRVAALRALDVLDPSTVAPLLKSLANDPAPAVRAEATSHLAGRLAISPLDALNAAAERDLPDDARGLHQAIVDAGADVALGAMLRILERVRAREASVPAGERGEWSAVRAAAHMALANRGSRLALYDLRESLEGTRQTLPVDFLAALMLVGNASCLEAIAGACTRLRDASWREQLAEAFRAIVKREGITRRHAAIKKIEKKWPLALEALWSGGAGKAGG